MYQAQRTTSSAGTGSGSHLDCWLPVGALQPTDQRLIVDSPLIADSVAWQIPVADCADDGVDVYPEHRSDFRCSEDAQV
jgi:hypothetical protein